MKPCVRAVSRGNEYRHHLKIVSQPRCRRRSYSGQEAISIIPGGVGRCRWKFDKYHAERQVLTIDHRPRVKRSLGAPHPAHSHLFVVCPTARAPTANSRHAFNGRITESCHRLIHLSFPSSPLSSLTRKTIVMNKH